MYKQIRKIFALIVIGLLTHAAAASEATYQLTVVNDWTPTAYPINYPLNAHFTSIGGGAHSADQSYWELGELASDQMELLAENGNPVPLISQITSNGGSQIFWNHWFCHPGSNNPACGSLVEEFSMDSSTPAITIGTMIAPTPDWFVGVSGLLLFDDGEWVQSITVPLISHDSGTEEGTIPSGSNPDTNPPEPISYVSYNPVTGAYTRTPTGDVVGSFTFELINVTGLDDTDQDGIDNDQDNCILTANPSQYDSNADGFGNACDADTNDDCVINFFDVQAFIAAFLGSDPDFDFNDDGNVNFFDFLIVPDSFLLEPGPSAFASCDN